MWPEAAQEASAALKKDAGNAKALYRRGMYLNETCSSLPPSLPSLTYFEIRLDAHDPFLPPSLSPSLGVARMHIGLLEEAKADLLGAAKADPQNKDIRVQVGREGGREG